jgi:signal transduction histidine kinase
MWWAVAGSALFMSAEMGARMFGDHVPLPVAASGLLPHAGLMASLILLGETRRSRHVIAENTRLAAARAALDREREFDRRAAEERLRIARELHDVLAHTLTGAAVQAAVAADTLADDPVTTRSALEAVRQSFREARAELSATLGLLRADQIDSDSREPAPNLAQLDTLLASARSAGLRAELTVEGEPHRLPPAIELTAYRIVQEALTNVIQHADAQTVNVNVAFHPDRLCVSVSDDGRGDANGGALEHAPRNGHGLVGMSERVAAVGGTITARGRPLSGFDVVATLPVPTAAGEPR